MGRIWGPDAVAKSVSTSFYGNCVALTESPKQEGLIYVGTDDGLIQVTENDGREWRKIDKFPGVPERTYVSRLIASQHDATTVYASFENHKNADFAPYLLKSTDAGKTWTSIKGDLPANGPVLAIVEDHVNANLLFVGTEFGLFFTPNGGQQWIRLKSGLPTISVRDLAIQRQMDDLVVGTFGRGFYVLDDYSPLRLFKPEILSHECELLPVKDALMYIQSRPFGLRGKGFLGETFYTADNPPFGAIFTYYLKDALKTQKQRRHEAEKEAAKKGAPPPHPSKDQLRSEEEEESPTILLTISDAAGHPLRTVQGPATAGLHRISWDLREPAPNLPRPRPPEADEDPFSEPPGGALVMPGSYKVSIAKRALGVTTPLAGPVEFNVTVEGESRIPPEARKDLFEFQQKTARLQRAVSGALEAANALAARLEQIKRTVDYTPNIENAWKEKARDIEKRNRDILRVLRGDVALRTRNENTPISVAERVESIVDAQRFALAKPTQTQRDAYKIAGEEFSEELGKLRKLMDVDMRELDKALNAAGAPWTPGRLPEWKEK